MLFASKKITMFIFFLVSLTLVLFLLKTVFDDLKIDEKKSFITIWKTDNSGLTNENKIKIGTKGMNYNYRVDWGDGSVDDNVKGDITHTYQSAGIYRVSINGDFPQIYFSTESNNEKILSIEQWGNTQWYSMDEKFDCCKNLIDNTNGEAIFSEVMDTTKLAIHSVKNNKLSENIDTAPVVSYGKVVINAETFNESFREAVHLRENNQMKQAGNLLTRISISRNLTPLERSLVELQKGHVFREEGLLEKSRIAYEKSLEFNSEQTNAMIHLADLYGNGFGEVEQNIEKMWFYLNLAELKGDIEALIQKGQLYRDGVHTKVNDEKAFDLFYEAMEAGDSSAMVLVSGYYARGEVVPQDKEHALELLHKAYALGNIAAGAGLGKVYYFGELVEQDLKKSFDYLVEAADKGHIGSMTDIGVMYDHGIHVEADPEKAIFWYDNAVNAGQTEAMVFLGTMYEDERGVEQDFEKAFELFLKAAKAGNSEAMVHLGRMYSEGLTVDKNLNKAFKLFKKSADLGNARGQCKLADVLIYGKGVEENTSDAIFYYEKGAAQQDAYCLVSLGELYENGARVSKDLVKAEEYYLAALKFGEYLSILKLANWYRDGIYYEKDHEKSKSMYEKVLATKYVSVYSDYALLLATSSQRNIRDAKKAVEYAEKATSINLDKFYLEALAAAYAANHQFKDAIRVQTEFLDFLNEINEAKSVVETQKYYLNEYKNLRARYN